MRRIQAFVLRLLAESDAPETLRGSIVCVSGGEPRTFTDAQGLVKLLAELERMPAENQSDERALEEQGHSSQQGHGQGQYLIGEPEGKRFR